MKRLRIEHETGFTYPDEAIASYNEARMLPISTEDQFVLNSSLDIEPSTSVNHYIDYFGTRVAAFDVLSPHTGLQITARSLVEVRPRPRVMARADYTWSDLARDAARSVKTVEQKPVNDRTRPHPEVAELARTIAAKHVNPCAAAQEIAEAIGNAVEYTPGATSVQSTAAEAWEVRRGVCQDMTHITLGALREVGIPARYVSGYLHPKPDAEIGEAVEGESHAWVEWFTAEWQGFDVTNNVEIGDRHVFVGHGRDYGDVAPLRGVYAGPDSSELHVKVTITRES